jgi:hypothetical protein
VTILAAVTHALHGSPFTVSIDYQTQKAPLKTNIIHAEVPQEISKQPKAVARIFTICEQEASNTQRP